MRIKEIDWSNIKTKNLPTYWLMKQWYKKWKRKNREKLKQRKKGKWLGHHLPN